MPIECFVDHNRKDTVRGVRVAGAGAIDVDNAIREARSERVDDEVLWSQPRVPGVVRNLARLVLGLGSTAAAGLLVALVVVGDETRGVLLVALLVGVGVGGSFVGLVWSADVGIEIRADGRLIRAGWGGVRDYDLRAYHQVIVKTWRSRTLDS